MFRTQLILVHAKNDGGVKIVAARMRKEHFLRASGNMRLAMLPVAIYARTIQHDIHAQFAPRQIRQRSFMQNTNDIVADKKLLALVANLPCKTPVAGIVFQQMRHACGIRQLVDGHHGISARRPDSYKARTTLRPMRPKPLIAMRTVIGLLQGYPDSDEADRVMQLIVE